MSRDRGVFESVSRWQEGVPDSSGSEKQEHDDEDSRFNTNVQFTLGGDQDETTSVKNQTTEVHSQISRKKTPFPRSYSQDVMLVDSESGPKSSNSEINLTSHGVRLRGLPLRPAPESGSVDDETYSTDSNSTTAEDGSTSGDKKRSKLRFPRFVRKSRLNPLPSQVLTPPVVSKPL